MKTMSRKLAMPLLGVLLWVISIHAGTFAAATLLPRPITGLGRSIFYHSGGDAVYHPALIPSPNTALIKIGEKDLNRSVSFGSSVVNRMLRLETNLGWSNIHIRKGSPAHGQLIVSAPETEAIKQGREALIVTKATIHLMNIFCNRHNLSPAECAKFISSYSVNATPMQSSCMQLNKVCSLEDILSTYRSIDGSCNHQTDGSRGVSFTGYKRLLHPEYLDGVQEPRRSVTKKILPSPRLISTSLITASNSDHNQLTLAVMLWSEFVEHDVSHTATSKMIHTGNTIECCAASGANLSPRYIHPFCAPISVPTNDKVYAPHGLDCMTYVRSIPALRYGCTFGPIDQINQATHYLDASQIYGSTTKKSIALRTFHEGLLDVTHIRNKIFLPVSRRPTEDCQFNAKNAQCYLAGDSRVNVHPQLTAMHIMWLREHNRIAKQLAQLNPAWDDEILYQEARRIVIAEVQHITYNEWIPEVLGKKYVQKIQNYNRYDDSVNPSVSNSFATAALRVLNSLMDGELKLYQENRLVNSSLSLRDHFNNPSILQKPDYLDALIRGLVTQTCQKLDLNFDEDITTHLFSNGVYGYDIFSLDIQRGRDHGLPSYAAYRGLCGLSEVNEFADFLDVMSVETVKSLKAIYDSPLDVDLIVGGLSERSDGDSLFGPTFSCIIADQFLRLRRGDRYFYSNEQQPKPFHVSQIQSIENVTLARIFCDNSDDIQKIQPHTFRTIGLRNELTSCNDYKTIPRLSLELWRETREIYY